MLWRKGSSGSSTQDAKAGDAGQPDAGKRQSTVAGASEDHNPSSAAAKEDEQRRVATLIRQSLAFAKVVSVLARSPVHKFFTLADLEWLVIPPLTTEQFAIAEVKPRPDGPAMPVAAVFWANVSSDVDKRLCENLSAPIRLKPEEWRSGDILWLVDAAGDPRVLPGFLQRIGGTAWKGRAPKIRTKGADGKLVVKQLSSDMHEDVRPG